MKNERPVLEWQQPLAFMAEAPLGWLIARGQIKQFATDSLVGAGDERGEWVYLLLSGNCQLRGNGTGDDGSNILQTFGSLSRPDRAVITPEESTVFCIRMAESSCQKASVVLHSDVGDNSWLDFRNPRQYIQAGWEAALQQLDVIKALIQTKETAYEFKPAPESLAAIV